MEVQLYRCDSSTSPSWIDVTFDVKDVNTSEADDLASLYQNVKVFSEITYSLLSTDQHSFDTDEQSQKYALLVLRETRGSDREFFNLKVTTQMDVDSTWIFPRLLLLWRLTLNLIDRKQYICVSLPGFAVHTSFEKRFGVEITNLMAYWIHNNFDKHIHYYRKQPRITSNFSSTSFAFNYSHISGCLGTDCHYFVLISTFIQFKIVLAYHICDWSCQRKEANLQAKGKRTSASDAATTCNEVRGNLPVIRDTNVMQEIIGLLKLSRGIPFVEAIYINLFWDQKTKVGFQHSTFLYPDKRPGKLRTEM